MNVHDTQTAAISLNPDEQALLLEEVDGFIKSVGRTGEGDAYAALRQAVEAGEVPAHLMTPLETVLVAALQSNRARRIHGPPGEQTLLRLFNRTPRGAAIRAAVQETNRALESLHGQRIDELSFAARTPGNYRLTIDTDRCKLTLDIGSHGIGVENVAVGL